MGLPEILVATFAGGILDTLTARMLWATCLGLALASLTNLAQGGHINGGSSAAPNGHLKKLQIEIVVDLRFEVLCARSADMEFDMLLQRALGAST